MILTKRQPVSVGDIIKEEYLEPLQITQKKLARAMGVSRKTINEICRAAKGADEVYLASDPDREGELISWHIGQEVAKIVDPSHVFRITFNEIS